MYVMSEIYSSIHPFTCQSVRSFTSFYLHLCPFKRIQIHHQAFRFILRAVNEKTCSHVALIIFQGAHERTCNCVWVIIHVFVQVYSAFALVCCACNCPVSVLFAYFSSFKLSFMRLRTFFILHFFTVACTRLCHSIALYGLRFVFLLETFI